MPKVFLTNPPLNMAETPLQYHRPLVPLGLAYLGAMLEEHYSYGSWSRFVALSAANRDRTRYRPCGVVGAQDNMLLSFYGNYSYERLRDRIAAHAQSVDEGQLFIGVSILSDGMRNARNLLRALRRDFPQAKLIAGGPHATFFPEDFYLDPDRQLGPLVDYVVQNEGELAILAIVQGLLASTDDLKANGPQFGIEPRKCNYSGPYRIIDGGQYGSPSEGVGAHVLDTLPPPAYFLFEDDDGRLPYEPDKRYGLQAPAANINSSRGCPHKCTFCTIPTLVPSYRTLSPIRIVELIRFLSGHYGVESIFFREDNFMYEGGSIEGSRWDDVEEICRELRLAAPGMRWAIEARADNLLQSASNDRPRLEILAAAGLTGIYVGVESGSETMLKRFVKGTTLDVMSSAIKACSDHNIAVVATECYGDPELFLRREYSNISETETRTTVEGRETILGETRAFMNAHNIPLERREEYALVGIPVSTFYRLLDREHHAHPSLVEHVDSGSRYIYPRGFRWWSDRVYSSNRRVRPYMT